MTTDTGTAVAHNSTATVTAVGVLGPPAAYTETIPMAPKTRTNTEMANLNTRSRIRRSPRTSPC